MSRWKHRDLEWFDVLRSFKANSSTYHARIARSAAERLRDEVVRYLGDDSGACERWKRGCNELWSFVNTFQSEKDMESQNEKLLEAFKKLICKYEHVQKRLYQLTYSGSSTDIERKSWISCTWDRLNLYYQFASCAIVLPSDRDRYARDALSVVGQLSDDGTRKLDAGSKAYLRWKKGCDDLKDFVETLPSNGATRPQGTRLLTAFTELIETFERVRYSLNQLVQSGSISERDPLISEMRIWPNIYYRYASYAIASAWLGMTEENHVSIRINLSTGESSMTWEHEPMKVSRKDRRRDTL